MSSLSISAAWDEAKAILARDGRLLATVALALVVLPQVILAVVGAPANAQATPVSKIVYAAVVLIGFVAQIAFNRLAIGPSVRVSDAISQGLVRLLPVVLVLLVVVFVLGLIAALFVMLLGPSTFMARAAAGQPAASLILLLVVLIALAFAIVQLVFPIAAVETGNPIRLITRSWQLARGNYLRLLGFILIVFVGLAIVGLASALGVGSVIFILFGPPNPGSMSALMIGLVAGILQGVFSVVTAVMLARIYVQLAGREAQASVPSSGT
jgi:hypothetical protein